MSKDDSAGPVFAAPLATVRRLLRHPLAGDTARLVVSQYASAGLGLLTTLVAARVLGPTTFGVATLAIAYPTLVFSVAAIKPASIATRYVAAFRAEGRTEDLRSICKWGYVLDLLVSLVTFILVAATAWWVAAAIYRLPRISPLMVLYAASFPLFSLSGTSWAVLSAWRRFGWLAVLQAAQPGITLVILVGFLLAGWRETGVVGAMALGQAAYGLAMAVAALLVLHRSGLRPWWRASLGHVASLRRDLLSQFGWNYLLVTLSGVLMQVPLIILGRLRGPEAAGYYRVTTNLVIVGSYPETSMGRVVYPRLSERWSAGERESLRPSLTRWTLTGGLLAAAIVLLAILILPVALPLLFGRGFVPAVRGAQVMLVGAAVAALFFWQKHLYYAAGRVGLWTAAYGLQVVIVLGLAWPVIRQWGFLGAAALVTVGKIGLTLVMAVVLAGAARRWR